MSAQLEQVPARTFREEGFLHDYPTRESSNVWPFMGYASEMVDLALRRDDAAAFIYFMRLAGLNRDAITFDDKTMDGYCDKRNAPRCKKALTRLAT